ncbi:MAG: flagellar basal-body MS-ring/collar protein FliF [bacterium]
MGEFFGQIQEQLSRVWGNLNTQQKALFIGAPTILVLALVIAVYVASRPDFVQLVSMTDEQRLSEIVNHLEANNIKYKIGGGGKTIYVVRSDRDKIRMDLAGQELLGPGAGPGFELFDVTRLGMTDRIFEAQYIRALQNELAKTIRNGARYDSVFVHLSIPEETLFEQDQDVPKASIKIISSGGISRETVVGIQNLVAGAVPKLEPSRVQVLDRSNTALSGTDEEEETGAAVAHRQDQVRRIKESELKGKIKSILEKVMGPEDFDLFVEMELDWTEKDEVEHDIDVEQQAVVSEKTYEEVSNSAAMAGEPGVAGNVQDTGIGANGGESLKTEIAENIANYDYPKKEIHTKHSSGDVVAKHISIILNYMENPETDKMEPVGEEIIDGFRQQIIAGAALNLDTPESKDTLSIESLPFDTRDVTARKKAYWLEQGQKVIKSVLPVIALGVIAVLGFLFFQKAFAPKPIEDEELEEVPIEPVTETREMTLAQLGLAEFGDIASLPAEEQRRLKMQEHVISYAQEKPEEVAAIIKAWLSG